MSTPVRSAPDDPARRPRSFGQRLGLLLVLLILPGLAVVLPTTLVTHFFGQGPRPKPTPPSTPALSGLDTALNHSAELLLPTPGALTPEPIRLRVRPDRLAARAEKISAQARALGGSAVDGVADPGQKHLFVDLPAGRAAAFRQAVTENTMPAVPADTPAAGAAKDQLEVILHADEDE